MKIGAKSRPRVSRRRAGPAGTTLVVFHTSVTFYVPAPRCAVRTVIDLDDEALADAAAELGTATKVATVNEALRLAAARRRTAAYLDLLAELDMDDTDRTKAWRAV